MNEERVTLSDGTQLWTTFSGDGSPVVLLNGGPGMADYLEPVAALIDEHYMVFRYEQRGCGRSTGSGTLSLGQFLSDIEELRHHWKIDQWFVIGHSWGVDLALAYALRHRASVQGVIGLSGGRIHNDRSWKKIYDENKHRETTPPAAREQNTQVNESLNEDWKLFCRRPSLLHDLAELKVPIRFVYGEDDIRPSWPTEQISQLLPNAEFILLPHSDHHLWQGNPDGLNITLHRFLNEQSTGL